MKETTNLTILLPTHILDIPRRIYVTGPYYSQRNWFCAKQLLAEDYFIFHAPPSTANPIPTSVVNARFQNPVNITHWTIPEASPPDLGYRPSSDFIKCKVLHLTQFLYNNANLNHQSKERRIPAAHPSGDIITHIMALLLTLSPTRK